MKRKIKFGKVLGGFEGFTIRQNLEGQSGVSICLGKNFFAGPYSNRSKALKDILEKFSLLHRIKGNSDILVKMVKENFHLNQKVEYGVFYKGKLVTGSENSSFVKCVTIANGINERKYFHKKYWVNLV